jgi:SAM-dependent methyltransferase
VTDTGVAQAGSLPWRDSWARSWRLLEAFRVEQSDPDHFYRLLATDSAGQVDAWHPLRGAVVVDIGGGPGYFEEAFTEFGATYVAVDADAGEMRLHGRTPPRRTIQADGRRLPFPEGAVDVTYSSNVIEHVADPWRMVDEMVRITKPGGSIIVSYTLWWGPWGGHETAPWHYLGGRRAAARYERHRGHPPKNVYGESLFPATIRDARRWLTRQSAVEVVAVIPRYLPRSTRWLANVPVLGELVTWNILLVLRRRSALTQS